MNVRIIYRSSRGKIEEGYLSLRLYYKGKTRQLATGLKLRANEWDNINSHIVLTDFSSERREYLRRINVELRNKTFHLERLLIEYKEKIDKGHASIENIVLDFRKASTPNSFTAYAELLGDKLIQQKQFRTAEAYQTTARRLVRFNKNSDLSLLQITPDFVERFERHLYEQSLSMNTISFYMRNLRAIYNKALQDKIMIANSDNPFSRVYTGIKSTPKRALSKEDMQKIYSLDLEHVLTKEKKIEDFSTRMQELEQARDLFLFSFHARGMSFVDIALLKKTDIKQGILSYRRRKTGQQLEIRISPALRRLINKYAKATETSSYLFPIIKDEKGNPYTQYLTALRKQNINLKTIQRLSGVSKTISTHVARHTWATIAKEENLPIWTISEGLGHTSIKTTYIYLASINRTKLDEANEIVVNAVGFY